MSLSDPGAGAATAALGCRGAASEVSAAEEQVHRTIHHLVVESVLLGRPAAMAGTLMLGGVLVGVEGKPTYGLAPLDVARLIPGAGDAITVLGEGSTVRVVVQLRRPPSLADMLWLVQCNRHHEQLELEDRANGYSTNGDDDGDDEDAYDATNEGAKERESTSTRGSDSRASRKSESDPVEIVVIRYSN